ncbi:E3 ubiquitin-protein ligase Mdm2 isoform X1 [Patella vulgata]|uniref:E3 ubiquitin-protein ligase Mdm2 isoform X1 n=2 Tax=Patella vulgata TaxID=6465 RepID=UPI00217F79A9|nr:E3 ubiquitin-protein ligase Mdm2 isoform X1 [Patella vulgata]
MRGFIPYILPMSEGARRTFKVEELPSIMVTSDSGASPNDPPVEKYIVEEEITVGIPLVRPSPAFLDVLRLAGAKVEVFTKKEICQYLKDYIGARRLYDATNPRIVYCENDPLEKVFGVKTFTINDVLDLIQKNVSCVPDTCIKRMRQMVCRTMTVTTPTNKSTANTCNQIPVIPSSQTSFTIATCKSTPIITSTTSTLISSSRHRSPKQHSSKTDTDDNSSNRKRKYGASSDPTDNHQVRKRRRSLNVTYSDSETASYPWYFHVKMGTSEADSEKLSVQDNATVVVEDSTDDMWFVEEDTISVQYDSDAFSVEYDVQSTDSYISDSDCSSICSGKDIFVMCNDSDVEFWADSSGTDIESDPEIPDSDKWTCEECEERNTPRQAYCRRCWKMRPGWFAKKGKKKACMKRSLKRSFSAPSGMSSSESSDSSHHRYNPSRLNHHSSSSLLSSDNSPPVCNRLLSHPVLLNIGGLSKGVSVTRDDSGISLASSSVLQSSQERGCFSQESISLSPIVRNTLSNFQIMESSSQIEEDSLVKSNNIAEPESNSGSELNKLTNDKYISSAILISDSGAKSTFVEPSKPSRNSKSISKNNAEKTVSKNTADVCVVCVSRPKTGSIIHGSSGHQVCCFKCAKQLKRRKKPCPVCRRPIQKVVRNYLL